MEFVGFFFCFCGNRPCNHATSFKKTECPNCHQHTLQVRRTDACITLCFILPVCPTDEGDEYYQCTNKQCNVQYPVNPVGRPVNVPANQPPLALGSAQGISRAPYSNQQPQQPVQPYQRPIGEMYRDVNNSNIYPGQQHAGYIYGAPPDAYAQQQVPSRPPTYGNGRVGGDGPPGGGGGGGGGGTGYRMGDTPPSKGTVAQMTPPSQKKGTVVDTYADPTETVQKGGTTAALPATSSATQQQNGSKQPTAPAAQLSTNNKQPSAPPSSDNSQQVNGTQPHT